MKRWTSVSVFVLAVAATGLAMLAGCEKEPDSGGISDVERYFDVNPYPPGEEPALGTAVKLTPDKATVSFRGQTVPFAVRGGTPPYDWSVANNGYGHMEDEISANKDSANYIADVLAPNVVTVTDSAGRAAQAPITVAGSASFKITPVSQTFSSTETTPPYWFDGETIEFAVAGGSPPYSSWHVTVTSLGTINPATGVYTVKGGVGDPLGTNTVWITDNLGAVAEALVVTSASPFTPPAFKIIPASSTFTTTNYPYWFDGETVNFGVVGGTGTITWHVTMPGLGTISPSTGRTTTYTVDASAPGKLGENIVWAEDALGNYAEAKVTTSLTTP